MKELTIETERLILRNYRLSDFEDHYRLCADSDVMRYMIGGQPMTRFEEWRHMAFLVGHWELLGYGYFAAVEKASGRFVGRIGFTNPEGGNQGVQIIALATLSCLGFERHHQCNCTHSAARLRGCPRGGEHRTGMDHRRRSSSRMGD